MFRELTSTDFKLSLGNRSDKIFKKREGEKKVSNNGYIFRANI